MPTDPQSAPDLPPQMRVRQPLGHIQDVGFHQHNKAVTGLKVNHLIKELKKDELLRLLLSGRTCKECATILKVNVVTVRTYARQEDFQRELRELSHEVWERVDEEIKMSMLSMTQRIDDMADRALSNIAALMESNDERVALRANQDILDRHPETSKHHKVDNTTTVMVLDPAQLALAARAAMEIEVKTIEGVES